MWKWSSKLANMRSKDGLNSNSRACFRITRGTQVVLFPFLEVLLPATLILRWLLHFPEADPHDNVIAWRAIAITRNCWIVLALFALWELISGQFKKVLLRINEEGIAFRQKGLFCEYEWREIEYLRQSNIFGRLILYVKTLDRNHEYIVNLEGCFWTFIPVRIAIRRFSKEQTKYYTRHQWKKHNNGIASIE